MTYKKNENNDFNVQEFQITERSNALNGFTDLNLQNSSTSFSNPAFSLEGGKLFFNNNLFAYKILKK